jgi:glycosyltransferase involved in cell wall biosynthesis
MHLVWNGLSLLIGLWWLWTFARGLRGLSLIPLLPDSVPGESAEQPLVSVIVAAKEEEATIGTTVRHLLEQDYGRYELIVVNDRSSDGTGIKLDELKRWARDKADVKVPLRIIHITRLPEGWLGKNHALYQGYLQARGQYLLFTDADIRFQPGALRKAMDYIRSEQADHLTLCPHMYARGIALRSFVHFFLYALTLFLRLWRANDDRQTRFGVGIGAFNLIRRRAYEAIGTHRAFAMRPDDDLQLGGRVKQSGFRQRFAIGYRELAVEWYPSLREAVRGLEKNLFSGFNYRIGPAICAIAALLAVFLFPVAAIWFPWGWAPCLHGLALFLAGLLYVLHVRRMSPERGNEVILLPLAALLLGWTALRSVFLALGRGGIYWRGTFYPLRELRQADARKPG